MPYETSFQTPRRVIYTRLTGKLSLDDVKKFNEVDTRLLRTGSSPVHIIFDTLELSQ